MVMLFNGMTALSPAMEFQPGMSLNLEIRREVKVSRPRKIRAATSLAQMHEEKINDGHQHAKPINKFPSEPSAACSRNTPKRLSEA
ncbi:unnamed protein product [Prunus armeniaca]|uniref:Uncharacterized protein n=1 Tax=Prunus armeniaca TaxID=36596 RepID=A0A6J5TIL5_PRUAR|nr:unnamed protein product [Prunus armeniaca]CAB4294372.1 unnamed protein product [Prunus armeniaca]